jgi:uncharacterized protein
MTDTESASSEPETPAVVEAPSLQERQWAFAAHLAALAGVLMPFGGNILGPLIVWQLKKNEMPFVDDQGKEALNFQITVGLAILVAFVLTFVIVGLILLPVIIIGALALTVYGAIQANNGETYRYPVALRLIS